MAAFHRLPDHAPAAMSSAPSPAAAPYAAAPYAAAPYAIVEASGQQFWLQPNRYYDLDRLAADVDSTVTLENVLLVNDGKDATLGQPYVKGASVELKVMAHRRGPKLIVYKMRPKKKTRRKNGHRQELTRVMVQSISVGGKTLA
jgi:large subunit ribosomal protein L21